jgi:hypothetical protein
MTRTENIEKIRTACIAANPSILDLTFGCELRHNTLSDDYSDKYYFLAEVGLCTRHKLARNCDAFDGCYHDGNVEGGSLILHGCDDEGYGMSRVFDKDFEKEYQRIGRPIRLADVLWGKRETLEPIEGHGRYEGEVDITRMWNLRADSLEEQSDECVLFLAELLKGKAQR